MTELRINTDDNRGWYLPGDTVSGRVVWNLDKSCEAVELRLFWHTSGKGTEDVEIIDILSLSADGTHGDRAFSFPLPLGPYSFSGALITLAWALELVVLPGGEVERVELIVAPTPVEVQIEGLDRPPRGLTLNLRFGKNQT